MTERDAVCPNEHSLWPGRVTVLARSTLLVCVLAVAVSVSSSGTAYAQNTPSKKHLLSTMTRVTLRVSTCPASYGYIGQEAGDVPTSASVTLPKAMTHDFGLFTDSKRTMAPLLAPRGWHCNVQVGGDGSTIFSLYPTDRAPPQSKYSNAEEIVATTSGGCQSCVADEVCPYFVNALTQIGYTGMPCNASKPNDELDDYVTGSSSSNHGQVDTYDPTTKKSKYATYGVLRYDDLPGVQAEDVREICGLPKKESSWCSAIIKEFVTENWEFTKLSAPPATTTTTITSQPGASESSEGSTGSTGATPGGFDSTTTTTTAPTPACPTGTIYSTISLVNTPTTLAPGYTTYTTDIAGTITNESAFPVYVGVVDYTTAESGDDDQDIGQEIPAGGSLSWDTGPIQGNVLSSGTPDSDPVVQGINASFGVEGANPQYANGYGPCPLETWVPAP